MFVAKDNRIYMVGRTFIFHPVYLAIASHDADTGSITVAIAHASEVDDLSFVLNVNVRDKDGANEAIAAGADVSINDSEPLSVASRFPKRWTRERSFCRRH